VLHLQKIVRGPLNVLPNLMTMGRSMKEGPQDEHVKGALEKACSLLLYLFIHRRHSTLDLAMMVGIRLSIVKRANLKVNS
jgi:hypothetical protein